MKVKLKSSGEIVDVEKKGEYYIDRLSNVYRDNEVEVLPSFNEMLNKINLEFEKVAIETLKGIEEEKERLYWRDVRKEILLELIRIKSVFHDVTMGDLVNEADMYVKLLKVKDR